ncbi:sensor histidine kinase [Paenibacillus sp. JDR-2]|uniref:sensor histidine kinase n=1 Tax=Paenibacillus sp. (strain JDR-2) TaxID=324057 RepID=UPI000166A234|nr:HAMP domain-containing sensor histidine kinase [Paenibacillus sp. JDR-2]ACT00700.1 histidine kinase [Paenibacillus sp. JDR-2]
MRRSFLAPRSLRFQLLQRSLFVMAALLLMIGILQYVLMKDFQYKNKAEALDAQLISLPHDWFGGERFGGGNGAGSPPGSSPPMQLPIPAPFYYQPGLSLASINLDGEFTDLSRDDELNAPQLSAGQYKELLKQPNQHGTYRILTDKKGTQQLVVFHVTGPPGHPDGIIQAGTDTASLKQILMTQLAIFIGLSVLALAAGLWFYIPLLRRTLRPLSSVVQKVSQTDAANLNERLPVNQGQLEIDQLAVAFNGMLERLDLSFEAERETTERMRRFIADASHELRTPLTSIHGFIEVLLRGAASNPDQLRSALTSMQLESKRINKLVEDLLLLAKLDLAPSPERIEIRLDKLLQEMEPQLRLLGGTRNVSLQINPGIQVSGHPDQLKQAVLNLFLNAVQHTDPDAGSLSLKLYTEAAEAVITVSDNGSGIAPEHLPHLFERFYRSESSRTRKSGGTGLGLAITQSLIAKHNGTIHVDSSEWSGSSFQIRLPLHR